uniref:Uncharacterized protein n=1 Tax=Knipowitschia caucasica TaxID=637954 RepID=A0AAV2KFG2_KNICA
MGVEYEDVVGGGLWGFVGCGGWGVVVWCVVMGLWRWLGGVGRVYVVVEERVLENVRGGSRVWDVGRGGVSGGIGCVLGGEEGGWLGLGGGWWGG